MIFSHEIRTWQVWRKSNTHLLRCSIRNYQHPPIGEKRSINYGEGRSRYFLAKTKDWVGRFLPSNGCGLPGGGGGLGVSKRFFFSIVGFHMTSLKFKLQNYRSNWDFFFHGVLEQLKTNFQTNFRFKMVLGFVIEYARISKLLRDAAFT